MCQNLSQVIYIGMIWKNDVGKVGISFSNNKYFYYMVVYGSYLRPIWCQIILITTTNQICLNMAILNTRTDSTHDYFNFGYLLQYKKYTRDNFF